MRSYNCVREENRSKCLFVHKATRNPKGPVRAPWNKGPDLLSAALHTNHALLVIHVTDCRLLHFTKP